MDTLIALTVTASSRRDTLARQPRHQTASGFHSFEFDSCHFVCRTSESEMADNLLLVKKLTSLTYSRTLIKQQPTCWLLVG
jgi:hypothetical protein